MRSHLVHAIVVSVATYAPVGVAYCLAWVAFGSHAIALLAAAATLGLVGTFYRRAEDGR